MRYKIRGNALDDLPHSLTHLTLRGYSNSVDKLPPSLKHLILGEDFDYDINELPPSLTHLEFLGRFNRHIDCLPLSLTHLTFGSLNRQDLYLPPLLTHLDFGSSFDQPVECLPSSLLFLKFSYAYRCAISSLPPLLISLEYGHHCHYLLPPSKTLENLVCNYSQGTCSLSFPLHSTSYFISLSNTVINRKIFPNVISLS